MLAWWVYVGEYLLRGGGVVGRGQDEVCVEQQKAAVAAVRCNKTSELVWMWKRLRDWKRL